MVVLKFPQAREGKFYYLKHDSITAIYACDPVGTTIAVNEGHETLYFHTPMDTESAAYLWTKSTGNDGARAIWHLGADGYPERAVD